MDNYIDLENIEPGPGFLTTSGDLSQNYICFCFDNAKFKMELKDNGDIFINEKLIENDIEIINGLKKFLQTGGFYGTNK